MADTAAQPPPLPPTTETIDIDMAVRHAKHRRTRWRPQLRAQTHPFLFTLMMLTAAAELGLTAFLIGAGNEIRTWSKGGYRSLLILLCFESVWTLLFAVSYMIWVIGGGARILAEVASSILWLLLTAILWGAATGFMHNSRIGGSCSGEPPISTCRQSLTVEALGWTEFSLCAVTLFATVLWMSTSISRNAYRDSKTYV
ncbi:hypothetical protein BDW22DRAFT_1350163 [Trametopsis cervina]|nr:hypothetical protein BDW22DRAFT_1350163 [Trametopsis cervina]